MALGGALMGGVASLFSFRPVSLWGGIPYAGPMWFLITLFTVKLISNFLSLGLVVCALIFLSIGWLAPIAPYLLDIPFGIGQAFLLLLFFELGRRDVSYIPRPRTAAIAVSLFVVVVFIEMVFFSGISEKLVNYQQLEVFEPPIFAILGSVSGIIITLWVSIKLDSKGGIRQVFLWVGKYSFGIYIWHLLVFSASEKLIRAMFRGINPTALMLFQLSALAVFVLCYSKIVQRIPNRCKSLIYV
jgi:peptidoglycan/LPS O-acetylase OafA/YrhL